MRNIDEVIGGALSEEDRRLLASPVEPGYVTQAFGLFRGSTAGIMWLVYIVSGFAFLGGAYAFWRTLESAESLSAIKWGVAAVLLLQMTTLCKSFMGGRMESNRMIREIKRAELQIALLRTDVSER